MRVGWRNSRGIYRSDNGCWSIVKAGMINGFPSYWVYQNANGERLESRGEPVHFPSPAVAMVYCDSLNGWNV